MSEATGNALKMKKQENRKTLKQRMQRIVKMMLY